MEIKKARQKERISILGCGWYGFALAKSLIAAGYQVKGSTTSTAKLATLAVAGIEAHLIDIQTNKSPLDEAFFNCDILIISIPPQRNPVQQKEYVDRIEMIVGEANKQSIAQVILISSISIYADSQGEVDEGIVPRPNTESGRALLAAEHLVGQEGSFTATIIRFGGLIGPDRELAKHFAGKIAIPNGLAPINLIHLNDCIGITQAIIQQKAFGRTYNAVAPDHPSRASFYTLACTVNHLPQPTFVQELLHRKQVNSLYIPKILAYRYQITNWLDWLKNRN